MIAILAIFLVVLFLPTLFVILCRSRKDAIEGSIYQRTTDYSNSHPVRMISLETVPALLFVVVIYSLYAVNPAFVLLVQGLSISLVFNIFRILGAWRSGKYE